MNYYWYDLELNMNNLSGNDENMHKNPKLRNKIKMDCSRQYIKENEYQELVWW